MSEMEETMSNQPDGERILALLIPSICRSRMQTIKSAFKFALSSKSVPQYSFIRLFQRNMSSPAKKRKRLQRKDERLVWVDLEVNSISISKRSLKTRTIYLYSS